MKMETNRLFLIMAGLSVFASHSCLALLGFGGSKTSTVKQFKSLNDAKMGILGFNIALYGDQNFLVSVGLATEGNYKNKEKVKDSFFASMEDYIMRNDKSLKADFDEIKRINETLFGTVLTNIYKNYIASNVLRESDRKNGLSGQDEVPVLDKISGKPMTKKDPKTGEDTGLSITKIIPRYTNPKYINLKAININGMKTDDTVKLNDVKNLSDKLTQIINRLNIKYKEYRASRLTSKTKGDAVEALKSLAEFIKQHCANVLKHFNALSDAKKNVMLKELTK